MIEEGWIIRPEDTCQDCLAESDDDLDTYLAAVVRNHPHVTKPPPERAGARSTRP